MKKPIRFTKRDLEAISRLLDTLDSWSDDLEYGAYAEDWKLYKTRIEPILQTRLYGESKE
jgi:hypothetical protein